jgi:hypothetical protein
MGGLLEDRSCDGQEERPCQRQAAPLQDANRQYSGRRCLLGRQRQPQRGWRGFAGGLEGPESQDKPRAGLGSHGKPAQLGIACLG